MDSRPPLDHAPRSTCAWAPVSLVCIAAMAVCLAPEVTLAAATSDAGDGALPMWVRAFAIVMGSVAIVLFATIVLWLGWAFLRAVQDNRDSIGIHSSWGGFGGGPGGWSLSQALSLLLAILLLGSITYGLTEAVMGGIKSTAGEDKEQQQRTEGNAAGQGAAGQKPGEQKPGDQKPADQKPADQKSADQKSADQPSTQQQAGQKSDTQPGN